MQTQHFTLTQHRNGYIEICDHMGNFVQTADTYKEAQKDIEKINCDNSIGFQNILQTEMENYHV